MRRQGYRVREHARTSSQGKRFLAGGLESGIDLNEVKEAAYKSWKRTVPEGRRDDFNRIFAMLMSGRFAS